MYGEQQGYPPQQGFGGPPRGRGRGSNRGNAMMGAAPDYGYGGNNFGDFGAFGGGFEPSPLDAEVQLVLGEMHNELATLDASGEYGEQFKNARRLLSTEVERLSADIDPEWLEVDIEKPIKLIRKVLIPTFRNPRFNYVGKVLGPKGTTLQNIAKQFKCHVYILGRGSTRDRAKEEELLQSGDPNYLHYGGPLHVKIETNAPPALAYERVSGVLNVLQQLLQPVKETHIPGITNPPEENDKRNGGDEEENQDGEKKEGEDGDNGQNKYGNRPGPGTGSNRSNLGPRGRGFIQRGNRGGFQRPGFQPRGFNRGRGQMGGPMRGRGRGNHGYAPY